MDDEWDWDRSDIVDLDVTGDPQLDQFGYRSPRRDFSPPPAPDFDYLGHFHRDEARREQRRREAVEANLAETRQRVAQGRGRSSTAPVRPEPPTTTPDLAPHIAQAVADGMPGRDLGWWRVDVAPDGTGRWTRVDAPGDGPRITVEQTPAQVRPPWQPVEQTQPSPGTRVW